MNNSQNQSNTLILEAYFYKRTTSFCVKDYIKRYYTLNLTQHKFTYRNQKDSQETKYSIDTHLINSITTHTEFTGPKGWKHPLTVHTKDKDHQLFLQEEAHRNQWVNAFSSLGYITIDNVIPIPKAVIETKKDTNHETEVVSPKLETKIIHAESKNVEADIKPITQAAKSNKENNAVPLENKVNAKYALKANEKTKHKVETARKVFQIKTDNGSFKEPIVSVMHKHISSTFDTRISEGSNTAFKKSIQLPMPTTTQARTIISLGDELFGTPKDSWGFEVGSIGVPVAQCKKAKVAANKFDDNWDD